MNEIIKSLYNRKSTRVYEEKPIPKEVKDMILEAAVQAPSAGCQQLYTILDITDQNLKEALSETCDHQPFIAKRPWFLYFVQIVKNGMTRIWKPTVIHGLREWEI